MKKFFLLPLFLILLSIAACTHKASNTGFETAKRQLINLKTASTPVEQKTSDIIDIERKLIKEGHVEFQTNDLTRTRKNILDAVRKYKAYMASDREYKSTGRISVTMVIRVPAADFDRFLADATRGVEKFDSKEIKVKDVTEEFLDVRARLKTKKELEQRYLQLLQKAKNVNEILEIEKQIGMLRAEIESIEGRLKYLQNRVSYATLTLSFYKKIPRTSHWSQKFKDAFKSGWNNFVMFFVVLAGLWPFILIGLVMLLVIKFFKQKNKS